VLALRRGDEAFEAKVEVEEPFGAGAVAEDRVERAQQPRDRRGVGQASDAPEDVRRRDGLFERLDTPVDVDRELQGSVDPTASVFRFLSRATAGVGLLSLLLVGVARPGERGTVVVYAALTLAIAGALTFVGRVPAVQKRADAA
jgi:hypothetical protein